jgi:hypothetical protein
MGVRRAWAVAPAHRLLLCVCVPIVLWLCAAHASASSDDGGREWGEGELVFLRPPEGFELQEGEALAVEFEARKEACLAALYVDGSLVLTTQLALGQNASVNIASLRAGRSLLSLRVVLALEKA